jgi:hypothetical protein
MKRYTVHLDIPLDGRNDYLVCVFAKGVTDAVRVAREQIAREQEYDAETMQDCEVLDVFAGHIDSLWDRPAQKPSK